MQNRSLVLFTNKYPYGSEIFLENELKSISGHFVNIIIIPSTEGENVVRYLPENATTENGYARFIASSDFSKKRMFIYGLRLLFSSGFFLRQVIRKPLTYAHPKAIKRLLLWMGRSAILSKWILSFIQNENIDPHHTVFYSYWLNFNAVALSILRKKGIKIKIVSRAHGFDLYDERSPWPHVSCKFEVLPQLMKVFPISLDGYQYLKRYYPLYDNKYQVSRLGVTDPRHNTFYSQDSAVIKILSASNVIDIKRVTLILEALYVLAKTNTTIHFYWDHYGDGPKMKELVLLNNQNSFENLTVKLHGRVPNERVHHHYSEADIDVFINVSKFEGIPFSIMEAHSYGVPVIATNVGGTLEIVNNENGLLLDSNPSPGLVAKAILDVCENREKWIRKRTLSKENWSLNFNAEHNFELFAKTIREL